MTQGDRDASAIEKEWKFKITQHSPDLELWLGTVKTLPLPSKVVTHLGWEGRGPGSLDESLHRGPAQQQGSKRLEELHKEVWPRVGRGQEAHKVSSHPPNSEPLL